MLGGAVGLILGSIRLPALVRILRVDPRIAAGTNLFIGFVMGAAGWVGHVIYGQVDWVLLVMMGAPAMVGSYLGANLTGKVNLEPAHPDNGCNPAGGWHPADQPKRSRPAVIHSIPVP